MVIIIIIALLSDTSKRERERERERQEWALCWASARAHSPPEVQELHKSCTRSERSARAARGGRQVRGAPKQWGLAVGCWQRSESSADSLRQISTRDCLRETDCALAPQQRRLRLTQTLDDELACVCLLAVRECLCRLCVCLSVCLCVLVHSGEPLFAAQAARDSHKMK